MAELAVTCTISTVLGTLDLESGGYELERASFEEVAVTWRKQEVSNAWVEGSFVTGAVKENSVRPLNVWVTGDTEEILKTLLSALTDALEQLQFTLTFGLDSATSTWSCQMADYSVRQEQGFRAARTALVQAKIPTKPTVLA